jgi:excisionase family DNA binding protein
VTPLSAADLFTQDGPFLVPELARVLRCSRGFLYDCIASGSLAAGKVGSDYRIPADEARRLAIEAGLAKSAKRAKRTT